LAVGCNRAQTPQSSAPGNASGAASASSLRTFEGDGFTVEAPADWNVLAGASGLGLTATAPGDVRGRDEGIVVSLMFSPISPPASASDILPPLLATQKKFGDVESETQVTVVGCPGTRVLMTKSRQTNDGSVRTRKFFVLVAHETGVLSVQAVGPDEKVQLLTPQLDALVASIRIK
jgi:hypothetical protein